MLCESCNQHPSTILFATFKDGVTAQQQLCRSCAEPLLEAIQPDEITGATFLAPASAHPPQVLPAEIVLSDRTTVSEFAAALCLRPFQVIGTLMRMDIFLAVRDSIDLATAALVCARYGVVVQSGGAER